MDCERRFCEEEDAASKTSSSKCVYQFKQSIVKKTESMLDAIQTDIKRSDYESAAVSLCHAYSLAPRRTKKHLRRTDGASLKDIVEVLERFCHPGSREEPPISTTKVVELILSPELDPNNAVAWRVKLRAQVELECYEEVVLNSDQLRSIPRSPETAEILLLNALAHVKISQKDAGVALYLQAFHVDAQLANACVRDFSAEKKETFRAALLEKATRLANNMMSMDAKDSVELLNYYNEIMRLQPSDMESAEVYGQLLMKLFRYEDAKVVFTRCIAQLELNGDVVEAVRFRLYHAECLVNVGGFDDAVLDYLEAMEQDSCLTQITVQSLSNAHVTKLTSCIIEQASALVNEISDGDGPDSEPNDSRNALQLYRKLYKLLYAIDSDNVEALRKCAECLQVAGKHEDAVELLTEAIRKTPSVHLLCERALSYLGMNKFEMAQTDLECASHLQTDSIEMHCCCSYLNFLTKKPDKAVQNVAYACSLSPSATVKVLRRFTAEQHGAILRGVEKFVRNCVKNPKKDVKAKSALLLALCDLLVNFSPTNLDNFVQYSELLVVLDMPDEAQSIVLRLIKGRPSECLPVIHLAALRLKLGQTNLAIEGFCSVLREIDEECLAAQLVEFTKKERAHVSREAHARGLVLGRDNKHLEAIDCFGVAIAATACNAPVSYLARACCLVRLQHYLKAISDFTAVLKSTPTCVQARCGRALVYMRLQEHLEASLDVLRSLHSNIPATTKFLQSLPEQKLRLVLFTIENYLQSVFAVCGGNGDIASAVHEDSPMTCGETILLLSNLLLELSAKNPKYLSMLGDAFIVHKRFAEAIASLKEAQELLPLDVSITVRIALLNTKLDDTDAVMNELRKLADDWDTLAFCVLAMDVPARRQLADASFKQGELLRKRDENGEALRFYSIAVAASSCRDAAVLRARGKCLETLQEYVRAIRDYSAVLTVANPLVSDYCARAIAYMMDEDETKACKDFMSALDKDRRVAVNLIASKPGADTAARIFLTAARIAHARKDYAKAHDICEHGIMLRDEEDQDLLCLMEKCANNMQKCVLQ